MNDLKLGEGLPAVTSTVGWLQFALDSFSEIVFVSDRDGRILACNKAAARLSEQPQPGVIGQRLEDVLAAELSTPIREGVARVSESGAASSKSLRFAVAQSQSTFELYQSPYLDADGTVLGVLSRLKDVSAEHGVEVKLATSTFQTTEERYRSLIAAMVEGVVFHAADGEILASNESAERILGLTADQIRGRTSLDPNWRAIHEDGSPFPGHDHPSMVTLRTGQPMSNVVMGVHRPDGSLSWITINSEPLWREGGSFPYGVVCSFSDFTLRKEVEDKLRESERRLAEAQRIARLGSWTWEPQNRKVWWSDTLCELFGLDVRTAEPSFEAFLAIVHPEDRQTAIARVEAMLAGANEFADDIRIIRSNGECIWIHSRARATRDASGQFIRVEGTDQDITDRKRTEHALRESEGRLSVALKAASAIAFVWDLHSDEVTRYYSTEAMLPENSGSPDSLADVCSRVHPDDREMFNANLNAALASGAEYRNTYRLMRADQTVGWLEEWGAFECGDDGLPKRLIGISIDVTERKRAEAELRRTSNLLQAVAKGTTDALFVKDKFGKYLLFNEAAARFVGKPISQVVGNDDSHLFDAQSAEVVMTRDRRVMLSGEVETYEETLTADGVTRTYLATKGPYFDESGNIAGVFGISHDITQRKEVEGKLKLIQIGIDHVSDSILWVNAKGDLVNVNEAVCKTLGYTRDELIGMSIVSLGLVNEAAYWFESWETLKRVGENSTESIFRAKDGSQIDMEVKGNYILYEGQELNCIIARDITERKRSEQRVATEHAVVSILARSADLREAAPDLLRAICVTAGWDIGELWVRNLERKSLERIESWQVDTVADTFLATGEQLKLRLGEGLPGRVWATAKPEWIVDFDDRIVSQRVLLAKECGLRCGFAFPIMFGTEVLAVATFFSCATREPDSGLLRMFDSLGIQMGQFMERKRAQRRLLLFRALIDQASDFILVIDPETRRVIDVNQRACDAHGWTRDEYLGLAINSIEAQQANRGSLNHAIEQLRTKRTVSLESVHRRKDGSEFPVEVNATMIHLERDYLVAIVRDITERQQVEDHLRQAQKMEAVGRLAGGVAHDFNNLLTVINCHTEFLLDKLGENPQLRENCLAIQYAGNRAAELTSQLLAFSRQTFIEPKVININEVVQSMRRLLVRFIREDITTSFQLDPEVVRFNADEGQIEQIIMNLVVNARDAMPEGGKLGFTTRNVILTEQDLASYPGLSVGAYACLEISDNGHGMSAETKDKIFEPFFTTKEVGKGTGLGLAVVHGVMQQCGGHVRVTSSLGAGTTFQLLFPATDLPQENRASLSDSPKVSATESILVVEDEDLVRRVVCIALKQAGFQVLKADSGAAAMAIIRDYEGPIDLVLTDVVMPEMSGRQLAEAIRAMKPGLRALFMSGHTEETMADLGLVETGDAFIAKPFTPASLIQKVREVLDRVQQ